MVRPRGFEPLTFCSGGKRRGSLVYSFRGLLRLFRNLRNPLFARRITQMAASDGVLIRFRYVTRRHSRGLTRRLIKSLFRRRFVRVHKIHMFYLRYGIRVFSA